MDHYIDHDHLRVRCNIRMRQIHQLSIKEGIGEHAVAELSADTEEDPLELAGQEMSGQPIELYSTRDGQEELLFFGVIGRIRIEGGSSYAVVHIVAYSVSWLMDLEQKDRSFQGMVGQPVSSLIRQVAEENGFSVRFSGGDQVIQAPFIQYRETDQAFLVRLASHLHLPVLAASDHDGKGIYVGFREGGAPIELEASREIWKMDAGHVGRTDRKSRADTYLEVTTGQIVHLGQCVRYKDERSWVQKVSMVLEQGILRCTYHLAGREYHAFPISYDPHVKGVSLTGTVLERSEETIKVHLDMDGAQDVGDAFPYPWLPEHGNMAYCMPETGSRIRLLVPGEDERDAIGIHCVREGGQACQEVSDPDARWFVTAADKRMTLQPSFIRLTADHGGSAIMLQDGVGDVLDSSREILIQAKERLHIRGAEVRLAAPKEVTVIRRQLGSPAVVNLCHNLDASGRYSTFKNLGTVKGQKGTGTDKGAAGEQTVMERRKKKRSEEEKEKRQLRLKELMVDSHEEAVYALGASIVDVLSAIPRPIEQDKIAQIALGARPITGRMRGR